MKKISKKVSCQSAFRSLLHRLGEQNTRGTVWVNDAKDFFIWSFGKSLQISRTTMSPSHSRKGSSLRFAVSSVIMKLSSISSFSQVFSRLLNLYRHCWDKYEEYLTVFFAHILPRMNCSSANLRQLRLSRKFQVATVARQHRLHAWLSPGRRPR